MPDMRVSLTVRPGTARAVATSMGATAPVVFGPTSVAAPVLAPGAAAPRHAIGAGVVAIVSGVESVPTLVGLAVLPGEREVVDMANQNAFGTRPSGFGEAFNAIQRRYQSGRSTPGTDARRAANAAAERANETVRQFNARAAQLGLPSLPLVPVPFAELVEGEGTLDGDDSGQGGASGQTQVMPKWRADP